MPGDVTTIYIKYVLILSLSLPCSNIFLGGGGGAQWLSGRVLDMRPKGRGFKPHRRHCVVSLSKNINPSLILVQPRKTRPFITERLLMVRKESNQTNKQKQYFPCSMEKRIFLLNTLNDFKNAKIEIRKFY